MALDDRLSDLLVDWEQSQRDGREPTLEELCKDAPELLPVVRQSIDSLKATRWMLDPDPADTSADDRSTDGLRAALHDTELPASHLTVEQFAASIFQSGLLSPGEIHELNQRLTASDLPGEAREIASRLVTEGKLTRYQASVLLKASKDPLLIDNYVILDTLDTGGMGLVFKALHRSMNRVVALKLLPAAMMGARDTVKRFQREVQAAAALSHPNIVAAYDAHQSSEIAYLVLEYVEGVNLFRLVKERGPLPVAVAANYVRQAATGLAYLHSRGIIHRDVKPANLILADDGTVKLLDMGLVRFASAEDLSCAEMDQELTQAGIVIGTVAYMSPEQALDTRSADQRSDIYSLGCTLFFLLTGRSLYHEETGMKTLLAHREQPVPTIREFCEEAPVSLDAVFRTMVAKRPADRLQTMTEIVAALDACVPGVALNSPSSITPRRVAPGTGAGASRLARGWKDLRSSPLRMALAVLVLVGVAAGGTYLAGILIRIKTKQGVTEVLVDDPDAEVSVKRLGATSKSPSPQGPRETKTIDFPTVTEGDDRRLAVWVMNLGGVAHAGATAINSLKEIPSTTFEIDKIQFDNNTIVDDGVLSELAAFRPQHLRTLYLSETRVTDKGMDALRQIPRLVLLDLSDTQITDEGVRRFSSLTQLQELDLSKTRITDKALEFLTNLPNLTDLKLDETQITDQGLIHTPQLKSLSLDSTQITDAGLKHLDNQTWLRLLDLFGTKVTKEGVAKLEAALPSCEIKHEPWEPKKEQSKQTKDQPTAADKRQGGPADQPTRRSVPEVSPSVDRQVAKWVLSGRGNFVFLRESGQVEDLAKLPTGEIHLMGINNRRGLPLKFSASDVERLASLSELLSLRLQSPSVTDEIVLRLKTLTKLKALSLVHARISDVCLSALTGMSHLSFIDLSDTPITDAGLEQLAKIKSLNDLSLPAKNDQRNIETAPGLYLGGIKRVPLPALILDNTRTTEAALLKLQRALPNCHISHVIYPQALAEPPASTATASAETKENVDREVAEWVLSQRGNVVSVRDSGLCDNVEKLPPGEVHLDGIAIGSKSPLNPQDPEVERWASLSQLNWLVLRSPSITDKLILRLSKLTNLTRLSLHGASVTDGCLPALVGMTHLSGLDLSQTRITDAGLEQVARLKSLNDVALANENARKGWNPAWTSPRGSFPAVMLDNTQTTEDGVLKLQQSLPNCTIFASHIYPQPGNTLLPLPPRVGSSDRDWANWLLSHSSLHCRLYADVDPETGIIRAEDLPPIAFRIQRLGFELPSDPSVPQANCDLNAFFFRRLADLPALRELYVAQQVPAEALQGLAAIKTLDKLSIQNKNAGDFHLEAIAKLNSLKSLWFRGEMITDAGVRRLASLKSLTVLALNGRARDLHGAGFEALSGLTNLRTLDVSGAGIDDEGARQIGRLFGLRKLVLRQTWISGKGLADLTGLKDLQILSLSRCRRLQADDLVQLSAFGSLRYLDLSDCRITDRSFAPIINTSPTTKSARGSGTPSALEAALRKFRNLKVLDLGGTAVSPEYLPEIRDGLPGVDITLQQRPLPDLPP